LEQTWSALWQEWDHIVDEAAQEDGNYIVRERHWEEPYFDSTTFVRDLERVTKEMRPLLRTAFEKEFVPATSFIDALLEADAAIMAAMPEWMYRLLPTSVRETRFSMAYSHPYEKNPMTWRLL